MQVGHGQNIIYSIPRANILHSGNNIYFSIGACWTLRRVYCRKHTLYLELMDSLMDYCLSLFPLCWTYNAYSSEYPASYRTRVHIELLA